MEKELIINRLPAKTWNYLKMNETHVTAETESIPCTSEIWCVEKNNAEDAKENIRTELPDGVGWEKRMLNHDEATPEEIEQLEEASSLQDISHMPARVKCAVLGWHTMEEMLGDKKEL